MQQCEYNFGLAYLLLASSSANSISFSLLKSYLSTSVMYRERKLSLVAFARFTSISSKILSADGRSLQLGQVIAWIRCNRLSLLIGGKSGMCVPLRISCHRSPSRGSDHNGDAASSYNANPRLNTSALGCFSHDESKTSLGM